VTELKIAMILGSTRPGRNGKPVSDWVAEQAKGRAAADYWWWTTSFSIFGFEAAATAIRPTIGTSLGQREIRTSGAKRVGGATTIGRQPPLLP
jgi:hypothetical protein